MCELHEVEKRGKKEKRTCHIKLLFLFFLRGNKPLQSSFALGKKKKLNKK